MENEAELLYEPASRWAGLLGKWSFDGATATYLEPQDPNLALGIAISNLNLRSGWVSAEVVLDKPEAAGRIVLGHEPSTGAYYSAGIGGGAVAYVLDQFIPGRGWSPIASQGASANLQGDRSYAIQIAVEGQHVWMEVDHVQVLSVELPAPLVGDQVGAIAWSSGKVEFRNVRALAEQPEAFVVMQYAHRSMLSSAT